MKKQRRLATPKYFSNAALYQPSQGQTIRTVGLVLLLLVLLLIALALRARAEVKAAPSSPEWSAVRSSP